MKKLTIYDIAKILDFDANQMSDLKTSYENSDNEGKVEIMDILWNAFFELHKKLSGLKYEELLGEVEEGKKELTNNLYLQAKQAAMEELESILIGTPKEAVQIEEIRDKLKNLTGAVN